MAKSIRPHDGHSSTGGPLGGFTRPSRALRRSFVPHLWEDDPRRYARRDDVRWFDLTSEGCPVSSRIRSGRGSGSSTSTRCRIPGPTPTTRTPAPSSIGACTRRSSSRTQGSRSPTTGSTRSSWTTGSTARGRPPMTSWPASVTAVARWRGWSQAARAVWGGVEGMAGSRTPFRLALGGHRLTVTHTDGFPVEPVEVDSILIGMGERYDVLVGVVGSGAFPLVAMAEGKDAQAFAMVRSGVGSVPMPDVPSQGVERPAAASGGPPRGTRRCLPARRARSHPPGAPGGRHGHLPLDDLRQDVRGRGVDRRPRGRAAPADPREPVRDVAPHAPARAHVPGGGTLVPPGRGRTPSSSRPWLG